MLALLALLGLRCLLDSLALLSEGIQSNAVSVVFFGLKTACIQGLPLLSSFSECIQGHVRMQSLINGMVFASCRPGCRNQYTHGAFAFAFLLCVLSHWSYLFRGGLFVDVLLFLLAWRAQPFWLVPARLCFYGVMSELPRLMSLFS